MPRVIRVRDVVRHTVHDLGPDEPMMRGPYDLFRPSGSVSSRGPAPEPGRILVEWIQHGMDQAARAVPAMLGDAHPGERVLLRIPPVDSEAEWWLCEVEAVDGVPAAV